MHQRRVYLLTVLILLSISAVTAVLIDDGNCEVVGPWTCANGCHLNLINDPHEGNFALLATGRHHRSAGPLNHAYLHGGHTYNVSAWAKLMTDHGTGQTLDLVLNLHYGNGHEETKVVATHAQTRHSDGWIQLVGDVTFQHPGNERATLTLRGPEAGVDFLIDDVTVTEVTQHQPPAGRR